MLIVIPAGPSVTDILQTVFAGGTLLVAIIASVVGLGQFRAFRANAREQTRPYVLVEFGTRHPLLFVEIKNVGTRPASNVVVRFSPEIESSRSDWQENARRAFDPARPIPVLAPGRSIQIALDSTTTAVGNTGLPQDYEVEIQYQDLVPRKVLRRTGWWWKRASERYIEVGHRLSLRPYDGALIPPASIDAIAKATQDIANKMSVMSAQGGYGSR